MGMKFIPGTELSYETLEGTVGPGSMEITRMVTDALSPTIGGGIVKITECKLTWTTQYDEIIHVLDGSVTIHNDGAEIDASVGDTFFFPHGTPLAYESKTQGAFFFALYPADWKKRATT